MGFPLYTPSTFLLQKEIKVEREKERRQRKKEKKHYILSKNDVAVMMF